MSKGILDAVPPKTSFLLGVATATALLGAIGFIVLASLLVTGRLPAVAGTPGAPSLAVGAVPTALPSAPAVPANISFRPVDDQDHVRGSKDAQVTVIEYSDLECPFCKRFHPTMQRLLQEYSGKVRWVYRHLPLDSIHSKARSEAVATECAAKLGGDDAFWKYVDKIFEVTPSNNGLDLAQLPQYAADIGLNRSAFETCIKGTEFEAHVQADSTDAISAGGNGTPYSLVIGPDGTPVPVSGAVPYESLKATVDSVLR